MTGRRRCLARDCLRLTPRGVNAAIFCASHWSRLSSIRRRQIAETWGTPHLTGAAADAVDELRRIDARFRARRAKR